MTLLLLILLLSAGPIFSPTTIYAHAFGQQYNLPVPFWLYLYGAAATIVASFILISYFASNKKISTHNPNLELSAYKAFKIFTNRFVISCFKIFTVFLFLLSILTGLFGTSNPILNFNMTFFWVVFVLGLTYLTFVFGNVYNFINPWKVVVSWFENYTGKKIVGIFKYPQRLGYFPALIVYFLFIWLELFANTTPFSLSITLAIYSLVNLTGALLWGKSDWFKYCEFFSVFFYLIGKIAPIKYENSTFYLRPPFIESIEKKIDHVSLIFFIIFMLSSTAYDGFKSTAQWLKFSAILIEPSLSTIFGRDEYMILQGSRTLGLILSLFLFLYLYFFFIYLAKLFSKSAESLKELSQLFAATLIPIDLAYNIAHYYTLILTQGQSIIKLISDPFGFGWNIFNTAGYKQNLAIVNAAFTWHSQVAVIVLGHIAGVYLSHLVALKVFPSAKKAAISQLPMLFLMLFYTMIGLWILSQPIVSENVRIP